MANKITLIKNYSNLPVQNNGLKLSEQILISSIEPHPKFKTLFSIDEDLLNRIADSMKKNGFDNSQAVHIWKTKENGIEHNYLIDGYTRVAACKIAGITMIPYYKHTFETFDETYKYTLHLQTDRRNLEGIDLLKNIQALMGSEYISNLKGNKNAAVGELLGISEKTVERNNKILANATEEQIERIANKESSSFQILTEINEKELIEKEGTEEQKEELSSGEKTQKEIAKEIKAAKKSKKQKSNDNEEISESLESNEGNPAPVGIWNHSDGIERPSTKLSPEVDSERTQERKKAYEMGLKKGSDLAYEVYDFICTQIENGKTLQEIKDDEHFADFSVSLIYKAFNLDEESE